MNLRARGHRVEILDGDEVRTNLSKGLGFSKEDRDTNIRRIGWVCRLLARNGVIAISAAISPYREIRDEVRGDARPLLRGLRRMSDHTLAERDVKGLYKKALAGEIKNFTGVSDPYEAPLNPEITHHSDTETKEQSLARLLAALEAQKLSAARSRDDEHRQLTIRLSAHGGGELVDLKAPAAEQARLRAHAEKLKTVRLGRANSPTSRCSPRARSRRSPASWVRPITCAAATLCGWRSGVPWSIPITLGVDEGRRRVTEPGPGCRAGRQRRRRASR